jgi:hypothetical protein
VPGDTNHTKERLDIVKVTRGREVLNLVCTSFFSLDNAMNIICRERGNSKNRGRDYCSRRGEVSKVYHDQRRGP